MRLDQLHRHRRGGFDIRRLQNLTVQSGHPLYWHMSAPCPRTHESLALISS